MEFWDQPVDSVEITVLDQQQISFLFVFQDRLDGQAHHILRIFFDTYLSHGHKVNLVIFLN
jgi:hypothetical protein